MVAKRVGKEALGRIGAVVGGTHVVTEFVSEGDVAPEAWGFGDGYAVGIAGEALVVAVHELGDAAAVAAVDLILIGHRQ